MQQKKPVLPGVATSNTFAILKNHKHGGRLEGTSHNYEGKDNITG